MIRRFISLKYLKASKASNLSDAQKNLNSKLNKIPLFDCITNTFAERKYLFCVVVNKFFFQLLFQILFEDLFIKSTLLSSITRVSKGISTLFNSKLQYN